MDAQCQQGKKKNNGKKGAINDYAPIMIFLINTQNCYINWYLFVNDVQIHDCTLRHGQTLEAQSSFIQLKFFWFVL